MSDQLRHISVMPEEAIEALALKPGMTIVDGTLGGAGHSQLILEKIGPQGLLLGLDADTEAIGRAAQLLTIYPQLKLVNGWFDNLAEILSEQKIDQIDALLLDLGFSSIQLDDPARGFSFQADGPLDMRLDDKNRTTAEQLINRLSEKELTKIFYEYGELYDSRRIAQALVAARRIKPITTTTQLVDILGLKNPGVKAKLFQALRIAVNDELKRLERVIPQAVEALKPGGRIAIITFHSLEDRIVKNSFRGNHLLTLVTKKPIVPTDQEIAQNPRSRSAKLRVAEKIA